MNYQIKCENLQKVHEEMKRLIAITNEDRTTQIVREAALNNYSAIVKTLRLLGLPVTDNEKKNGSNEI